MCINLILIGVLVLLLVFLKNHEGFELYFNTEENRMKHTCDLIENSNPDMTIYESKKEFNNIEKPYELTYQNKSREGPYAQCSDNVMDLNIEDNYRLKFDKTLTGYLKNPAESGDVYYGIYKETPISAPHFYKF